MTQPRKGRGAHHDHDAAVAALALGERRWAARAAPRPTAPTPATRRADMTAPVVELDHYHKAREVSEIAGRLERRQAATDAEDTASSARHQGEVSRARAREEALAAVATGSAPNVVDAEDLDVVVVQDPFDHSAGGKRTKRAVVTLRNDPVGRMHKRGQITAVQLAAARRWQETHEHAEIGGARAIDYSRDKVDGGRLHDAFETGRLAAAKQIKGLDRKLGEEGTVLVRRVLYEKMELVQVAAAQGDTRRGAIEFIGARFRECLSTLARAFGYSEVARGKARGSDRKPLAESYGEKSGVPPMHEWNYRPTEGGA